MSEQRKHEVRKYRKKEGRVKPNAPKDNKELDKWLEDEMRSEQKEEEREWKSKNKCTEVNIALMLFFVIFDKSVFQMQLRILQ